MVVEFLIVWFLSHNSDYHRALEAFIHIEVPQLIAKRGSQSFLITAPEIYKMQFILVLINQESFVFQLEEIRSWIFWL